MSAVSNIVLIEKNYLLRAGIEALILELPGLLIKQVFDGSEKNLFERVLQNKPDYIIVDPDSILEDFIPLISKFQEEKVTLIGLIIKNCPENICSRFKYHLPAEGNKHQLLEKFMQITGSSKSIKSDKQGPLSKREIDILREVVKGLTNQEVADKLFLSVHTVMTHRKNITRKLGIKTVSGLMVYAIMNNFLDINEVN